MLIPPYPDTLWPLVRYGRCQTHQKKKKRTQIETKEDKGQATSHKYKEL